MNPEFQRNLWLEWTRPRLTSAFAALAAVLALAWLANGRVLGTITANAALACIAIFTLAWGAHLCGQSLIDELRSRTWDQQRMSSLSPWRMTWGKLAGAPAVAWACGAIAGLVYLLSAGATANALWVLLALTAASIGVHASALTGALTQAQRGHRADLPLSLRLAAALGLWILARELLGNFAGVRSWYGVEFPPLAFSACVLSALAAWLVFGSYRLMCDELKVRTRPWALASFILFVACLVAGFSYGPNATALAWLARVCTVGLCVALFLAYVCALSFVADPVMPRRLLGYARRGLWQRVGEEAPLWVVAVASALPLGLLAGLLGGADLLPTLTSRLSTGGVVAILLYATRDLAVFFGIACRAPQRGVEASQLIYLALAYGLLPAIAALAGGDALGLLLRPAPDRGLGAIAVLIVHASGALWWSRAMWLERMGARQALD